MSSLAESYVDYYRGSKKYSDLNEEYQIAIKIYFKELGCFVSPKSVKVDLYLVPISVLGQSILEHDNQYKSFTEYHEDFKHKNVIKEYKGIWPIILDDLFDCVIADGWHRFHYYVDKGMSEVPCIIIK